MVSKIGETDMYAWDIRKTTLKSHPRETAALRKLASNLNARDKKRVHETIRKLDRKFLQEKAELVLDTVLEIAKHSQTTPNTLLQRNVWSSLDAIALHLDHSGFTKVFQDVAPKLMKGVPLDAPDIMRLEYQAFLDVLGVDEQEAGRMGFPRYEIEDVIKEVEREMSGKCGWKWITSPGFTVQKSFAKACGRPDKMLEIHHSPQSKVLVATVIGILNLIFVFNIFPLAVVTLIIIFVAACAGC